MFKSFALCALTAYVSALQKTSGVDETSLSHAAKEAKHHAKVVLGNL